MKKIILIIVLFLFSFPSSAQITEEDLGQGVIEMLLGNSKMKKWQRDALSITHGLLGKSGTRRDGLNQASAGATRIEIGNQAYNIPDGVYSIRQGQIFNFPSEDLFKIRGTWYNSQEIGSKNVSIGYVNGELVAIPIGCYYEDGLLYPKPGFQFIDLTDPTGGLKKRGGPNDQWIPLPKNIYLGDDGQLRFVPGYQWKYPSLAEEGTNFETEKIPNYSVPIQNNNLSSPYHPEAPEGLFFYNEWANQNGNNKMESSELRGVNKKSYNLKKENIRIGLNVPGRIGKIVFMAKKGDEIIGATITDYSTIIHNWTGVGGNPYEGLDFMDRLYIHVAKYGPGTYTIIASFEGKQFQTFSRTVYLTN